MNKDEILRELSPIKEKEKYRWDVYGKNKYSPCVKVNRWWYHREGFPKDYDAFNPPGDLMRSSYVRLGTWSEDESHWISETLHEMEKGLGDSGLEELIKQSQPRPMLTFLGYPRTLKPRKDLLKEEIDMVLPRIPRDLMKLRYSTTHNAYYKWIHIVRK